MKLASFISGSSSRALGVLDAAGARILDVAAAGLPADLVELIALGPDALAKLHRWCRNAPDSAWLDLSAVSLKAPLQLRRNMFCVGKNYRSHAAEFHHSGFDASSAASDEAIPSLPVIFTKATTSVIGPGEPIQARLDETRTTDYEGELAVVIGKEGRSIPVDDAMNHVFGFTIVNDVTARQLQRDHRQWFIGKSIDGFCPLGPWVVTRDELADLGGASIRTWVDAELRQQACLSEMVFDVPSIIAAISRRMTLLPGDVIATGTPEGVGIGFTPPRYLRAGAAVRIEIEGIGVLENPVE